MTGRHDVTITELVRAHSGEKLLSFSPSSPTLSSPNSSQVVTQAPVLSLQIIHLSKKPR